MLHQLFMRILGLIAALGLSLAPLQAQTVSFSVPDTTARKGDTLFIPITVSTLSATDSVYSGEWDLSFSSGVIEVFGIETAGTLSQSPVTALYNTTTRAFAFASTGAMTGSGVFVYLKVRVLPQPNRDTTTIFLTNGQVNEGNPSFTATGGKLRVLGIQVSPKTPPSLMVVGGSLQFAVSGDQIPPLTWTLSSPTVGTVSATGLFDAVAPGQTKVYVEDSRGLKDSTNLFPIYPASAASLTISVPDTSYTQTLQFNMPVRISDVTGLGILSAQFAMTFSSTRLQAMDVVLTGSKAETWAKSFDISSGRIDVALAGADTLSGSGVLVYIRMRVLPAASGASTVSFSEVIFNENLTASVQTGQFTPIGAPTVVVAPSTATVVREDSLQFSVTSGGTSPYVWSVSNPSVASIDEGTGLFTAIARGTTTVSVMDALGFVGTSGTILVNDVSVALPDTGVWIADSVDIPIFIDDVTGLDISSLQIRVVYDSSVVKFLSVETTGTLAASFSISYKDTLDTLRIAAAGALPIAGAGPLLKLRFGANTLPPGTAPLTLVQCLFNEPGPNTPTAKTRDGSLSVVEAASVPVLSSPADAATGVAVDASLVWNSSPGATSYYLQLSLDPAFGSFVENVGGITDTSFVPSSLLMTDTAYYWRVRAGNSGGATAFSSAWSFIVANVNQVPVLVLSLPDTVIAEAQSLSFTLSAVDPDSDPVSFSVVSGPAGAGITPGGLFSWTPSFLQAGVDTVVFGVNDGLGGVLDTAIVTVLNVNRLPGMMTLLSPADDDTVQLAVPLMVDFRWSRSIDPDADDTLRYLLRIQGPALDTSVVVTDTSLSVDLAGRLLSSSEYSWSVRATDLMDTVNAQSFSFRTSATITSVGDPGTVPTEFTLSQNFPNPFNPSTNIRFGLPKESHVRITAFDMAGNEIGSVFSGVRQAGVHQITFDGASLASGVYFYRLVATPLGNVGKSFARTMKMVLVK
ncbi:MAG: cohesin domain-containing protein [Bacteroidota bacterium]